MTLEDYMQYFAARGLRVHLILNMESWVKPDLYWSIQLIASKEADKLEIMRLGSTALQAAERAYDGYKPFDKLVGNTKVIEYKPDTSHTDTVERTEPVYPWGDAPF